MHKLEPAHVELVNGAPFRTRTSVVASGVAYRRLQAPGVEELIGSGKQLIPWPANVPPGPGEATLLTLPWGLFISPPPGGVGSSGSSLATAPDARPERFTLDTQKSSPRISALCMNQRCCLWILRTALAARPTHW